MTSGRLVLAVGLLLSAASAVEAARREPEATLRDLGARSVSVRQDQFVPADADRAASSYREFLEVEGADPSLRAQALRRVGDLSLARSESLRAQNDMADAVAHTAADEAIAAYQELLDKHPDYGRTDEVLYQLARAWDSRGDAERAQVTLDRLVLDYPGSRHYAEAQFRRGESFFSAGRYAEAEAAFKATIGRGEQSGFYRASLYKHGWSLFKQSRNEESSQSFLLLLDLLLAEESLSRPEREMADDALRALSIGFAAADGPVSVRSAVQRHGSVPYESQLYASLGDLYVEKERYQDAAEAYRAFAQRSPEDPASPLLLVRAIDAYAKGGFSLLVLEGKGQLVELYGPESAFWRAHGGRLEPEVSKVVQANLLDLARHHHAAVQQSSSPGDLDKAVRWYRQYLAGFDNQPDAPATRLMLADLLFENGRYLEAASDYEAAAYAYPGFGEAGHAGYAALVAYERAAEGLGAAETASLERRALDSAIRFTETFPSMPEVPAVLTRSAESLFQSGDRVRAEELAKRLLAMGDRADTGQQRVAWSVLANTYFDEGRYLESEAAFRELSARLLPDDPELGQVTDRLAASVYRQAEARQAAGDVEGAVRDFLRVADVAPGSSIRINAEYDAASLLMQSGDWEQAAQVLAAFRREHPGHELQAEVTRKLAVAYLEGGRTVEAAAEFERVSREADDAAEMRRTALWQAAELYAGAGQIDGAKRCFAAYVQEFPQPFDAALEARHELAEIAQAEGDAAERRRWLEEIVTADASSGAGRSERSRYLAAGASLELARSADAEARSVRLALPLPDSLRAKRRAMESALEDYGRTVDYGLAEFSTEATFAMAELYGHLGQSLVDSDRPGGLSAEELEQYELLLEEQAFPFEEKAIDLHALNVARAVDGLYDDWVRRSYDALAKLVPARYARSESDPDASLAAAAASAEAANFEAARALLADARWEEAIVVLEQALATDPGHAPGWNRLGIAYRQAGRFADARRAYESAIAIDPALGSAERNLAILLDLYLQDPEAALRHYELCLELSGGADSEVESWLVDARRRIQQRPRTAEVLP